MLLNVIPKPGEHPGPALRVALLRLFASGESGMDDMHTSSGSDLFEPQMNLGLRTGIPARIPGVDQYVRTVDLNISAPHRRRFATRGRARIATITAAGPQVDLPIKRPVCVGRSPPDSELFGIGERIED